MAELSAEERAVLIQHVIKKYEKEDTVFEKLGAVLPEKEIGRGIDALLGTQRIRRIGPDTLENNESHTEMPELPDHLRQIIDGM